MFLPQFTSATWGERVVVTGMGVLLAVMLMLLNPYLVKEIIQSISLQCRCCLLEIDMNPQNA